jgi:two-component system sensor histidine kinase/response regulator
MEQKYSELRQKAEKILQTKGMQLNKDEYKDFNALLEELNIYHIELAMQNQELQKANDSIEKEKLKYRELYMEAPVPYFTLNKTGNILGLNFAAARLIGLPIHHINQTSLFPYIEKQSKQTFSLYFKELFRTRQIEFGEIAFVRPDKSIVPTKLSAYVYYDNEHSQDLCRCIADDLTKEKQYQRKLAESENRFKTFFHADKSIKIIIEQYTGKIIDANRSAIDYYGYSDIIGKNISEINTLNDEEVRKEMENAGLYQQNHFHFKHKLASGAIRDVEVYSTPMNISGKNVLFSIIHDITAQKETEEKLNKQNLLFKSITDNMYDMVSLADMNGNFQFVSKSHKILGYKLDYLIGKNVMDFVHPDDKPNVFEVFNNFLQKIEGIDTVQFRYKCKDDNYIWLQTFGKIIDEDTILFSSRDITQIKEQEFQLKELVEQLKKANIAKDKFVNILAHDLRSPFNGMLGFSELMLEEFNELNKEEIYEYASDINKLINNTNVLLTNILDWSRIQLDRMEFHPKKTNIYELLKAQLALLSQTAKHKSINIQTEVNNELDAYVDKQMISAVIRNLLNNAIKFTPHNGKIIIAANKSNNNLQISVADNGVGMDDNKIKTLFLYEKTESEKGTDGESGTGFGLELCKEFVEMHKGKINVLSFPGKGSTFIVTLPIAEQE